MTESISLEDLHKDITLLIEKVTNIEVSVNEINVDLHEVRPEYLEKLERVKKDKFHHFEGKAEFLHFLQHEI